MKRVSLGGMFGQSVLTGRALVALMATLVVGSVALSATPAKAVPFDNKPKILLHLKALTTKNQCTTWGNLADCTQAVTRGQVGGAAGPFYYMYMLVATGPYRSSANGGNDLGVAGTQCGVDFDGVAGSGVEVFTWNLCATLEFVSTGWPQDGGGNLITWDSTNKCQKSEVAIAGYFYCGAYSSDTFKLIARPVDSAAKIADCNSTEVTLDPAGDLGFAKFSAAGDQDGCNPCNARCDGVPVEATTWSKIKGIYDAGKYSRSRLNIGAQNIGAQNIAVQNIGVPKFGVRTTMISREGGETALPLSSPAQENDHADDASPAVRPTLKAPPAAGPPRPGAPGPACRVGGRRHRTPPAHPPGRGLHEERQLRPPHGRLRDGCGGGGGAHLQRGHGILLLRLHPGGRL